MAVFKRAMAWGGAATTAWWLWTALTVVFADDPTKRIFDVMDFYDVLLIAELLLCGWTAAGRRIEPASVGASILLATAITKVHLVTRLGHNFLMDHDLYPAWFYHGKHYVNAQYALILFGLFFVVPFLVALIRRRSMDRIYTGFIVFVGIGTTAMFHLVLIELGMNPEIDHIRADRLEIMKILAGSDPLVAKPFCERMNLLCYFGADAARIPYPGTNGNMSLEIWEKAMRREAWGAQGGDALSKRGEEILAGPVVGDGQEIAVMPVAVFGPKHGGQLASFGLGDKRGVIIDPSNERWLIDRTRLLYCILGAGASFWWLLGGTILIETHRRRWMRRKAAAGAAKG